MQPREFMITGTGSTPTGGTSNGRVAHGTVNNCAHGITPWGTFLSCEENWNGSHRDRQAEPALRRVRRGLRQRWHTTDPRWDLRTNPNEAHLFGWVMEIDPYDPTSIPVKRKALGRFKHESAQFVADKDERLAFYMGDDERNEYIYKFVCKRKFNKQRRGLNRDLLDEGTLYVARFDADLSGAWLPLTPGAVGS